MEFLPPAERFALVSSAQGWPITVIAVELQMDTIEVRRMMARSCRTLITWERNACRWSTRFVAQEPWSEEGRHWRPGDTKSQDVN